MKNIIKGLLRENINHEPLNNEEEQIVDYILGDDLNEGSNEMFKRFMDVIKSNKKHLITAVVMTTLMANPAFSQEIEKAPDNIKASVEQLIGDSNDTYSSNEKNAVISDKSLISTVIDANYESGKSALPVGYLGKVAKIIKFVKANPDTKIMVTASESKVPYKGGVGVLAKKRGEKVLKFFKDNYPDFNVVLNDVKLGTTKWINDDPHDKKYTKDQYIKIEVFEDHGTTCDVSETEKTAKGGVGSKKDEYRILNKLFDDVGSFDITVGNIPDRVVILDESGVTLDTGFFADEATGLDNWRIHPKYVAVLSLIANNHPDFKTFKGTTKNQFKTFNSFEELTKALSNDSDFNYKSETDKESVEGLNSLKQVWEKGVRDYLIYDYTKDYKNVKINGKKNRVDLFSPLAQTGYIIKGNCPN